MLPLLQPSVALLKLAMTSLADVRNLQHRIDWQQLVLLQSAQLDFVTSLQKLHLQADEVRFCWCVFS